MPPIQVKGLGPFLKGIADAANEALDLTGTLRFARNAIFDGAGRLLARPGTQLAMTLKDDGGGPANVTSILAVVAFADGALAVAHSTVTSKFYLYRFDSDLSGWYNAAGAFQANLNAQPVGVLWSAVALPSPVFVAEGLGEAFIAHSVAGSTFRTKRYSVAGGIGNVDANLRGSGVEQTFFRGVVSFQQHLWGWGYGSEAAGENDRPELLRFGIPIFGLSGGGYFAAADSLTVGHRVRSYRERVVACVSAGEVLYCGTPESIWPVTGAGKNSWDKSRPRSDKFGFAGGRCACEYNGVLYFWSRRGPARLEALETPEPLWHLLPVASRAIANPGGIIAVADTDNGQVVWLYQSALSGRISVLAAWDVEREVFVGPDGDIGLGVGCAGLIQPTGAAGPSAAPNSPTTTGIGGLVATANWVNGDANSGVTTVFEYKRVVDVSWIVAAEFDASTVTYQMTNLLNGTDYHWRVKHRRNGQDSVYLGPVAGTLFTTAAQLQAPTNCALNWSGGGDPYVHASWHNEESGASTEVWFQQPGGGFFLAHTVGPGAASDVYPINGHTGVWGVKVRHVKDGYTTSNFSGVANKTVS